MPLSEFRLETIIATLESGTRLAGALFFPELSACGPQPARLVRQLEQGAEQVLRDLPRLELARRRSAGTPEVREVFIELKPPAHDVAWQTPVRLRLHVLFWDHGTAASIAYVPALDIEVVARRPEDLQQRLPEHIRFALLRSDSATGLRPLVWLGRYESVSVQPARLVAQIKTPREIAAADEDQQPSVLVEAATDLTKTDHAPAFEMGDTVGRLADTLCGRAASSVLLVGPSGVGKTAAVQELVRRRREFGLGRTPFWSTSGARLVAGMCGFGMWQERCRQLCREAAKTKAVVHLGNLVELMQVGQHVGNDQGVGHFLRPYVERGELLAVVECTPEQLTLLQRDFPNVVDAFAQVPVEEPSIERGRAILRRYVASRSPGPPRLDDEAIAALDRLHRRYATYSAYPGRPLRFLRNLLEDHAADATLDAAAVTRAFAEETGLPRFLLEDDVRLDLPAAAEWFGRRVIGQQQAVDVVVDLLATVKAGLARPERPIASLLFIGPTGVGKTEMAKALAEFLYRDPRRLLRIDMSEYAEYASVDRLIGGLAKEGLLTSQVRQQPFGIVLLDEFEKAHPRFFDMLLQVLGEGRLTDAAGRLASFRNSVIIMTSNLGSETFGRGSVGFGGAPDEPDRARQHFLRHVQQFVRPELFGRIDRVVPFLPLSRTVLCRIARRELELLGARDGLRYRDLDLAFDDALAEWIVRHSYDPRYGARPIKRAIERELLAPLSAAINDYAGDVPLAGRVEAGQEGLRVTVRGRRPQEQAGPSAPALSHGPEKGDKSNLPRSGPKGASHKLDLSPFSGPDHPLLELAGACAELRRDVVRTGQSHVVVDLQNNIYRLEGLQKRATARKKTDPALLRQLAELPPLHALARRIDELGAAVRLLEDRLLLACYTGRTVDADGARGELAQRGAELESLVLDLYGRRYARSDRVTLAVYGEQAPEVFELGAAYFHVARARAAAVELYELGASRPEKGDRSNLCEAPGTARRVVGPLRGKLDLSPFSIANGETVLEVRRVDEPEAYLAAAPGGVIGLGLTITGRLAYPLLEPERGLHVFTHEKRRARCLVDSSEAPLRDYVPPDRIDRRGAIANQPPRRVYDTVRFVIDDKLSEKRQRWTGGALGEVIGELVQQRLLSEARAWIRS